MLDSVPVHFIQLETGCPHKSGARRRKSNFRYEAHNLIAWKFWGIYLSAAAQDTALSPTTQKRLHPLICVSVFPEYEGGGLL